MINDSIPADLINKVYPTAKPANTTSKPMNAFSGKLDNSVETNAAKPVTSSISTKLTSPSLIEFHTESATLPEWRLQLQNTVRQRNGRGQTDAPRTTAETKRQPNLMTKGATALKIEPVLEIKETETAPIENQKLASALERIKNSRQKFLVEEINEEAPIEQPTPTPAKTNKNYPFYIASKTNEADVKAPVNQPISAVVKPTLATSLRTETKDLDTNKLPPLPIQPEVEAKAPIELIAATVTIESKVETNTIIENKVVAVEETNSAVEPEVEENDDIAPFAMRFNAGLFDLIIGSFLSLILLAPFILMSEGWSSFAGISAFLATCAVVMFVYLTTTISMYGKTFGMRLFSLELIDAEDEEYPTLHQAAVSSAVYLLSLAFGGIGFLTLAFNEEKRAAHDLISGTVVVKEI